MMIEKAALKKHAKLIAKIGESKKPISQEDAGALYEAASDILEWLIEEKARHILKNKERYAQSQARRELGLED